MITSVKIFMHTLGRYHKRQISVDQHLAVPVISVADFPFVQLKRYRISEDFLIFPEISSFIIPCIHTVIQNTFLSQTCLSQNCKSLQISYQKSCHSSVNPLSDPDEKLPGHLTSHNMRKRQIHLHSSAYTVIQADLHGISVQIHSMYPLSFI